MGGGAWTAEADCIAEGCVADGSTGCPGCPAEFRGNRGGPPVFRVGGTAGDAATAGATAGCAGRPVTGCVADGSTGCPGCPAEFKGNRGGPPVMRVWAGEFNARHRPTDVADTRVLMLILFINFQFFAGSGLFAASAAKLRFVFQATLWADHFIWGEARPKRRWYESKISTRI